VVTHFLPHLNRDAVYRILKAEGLNRLPAQSRSRKPHGAFKEYDLGFVHLDIKHLPKLRDREGATRKRFLFVAIDRCSRWVHLAVKEDETAASAVAFLKEAVQAFPFTVTHVLTDRGSCFTADGFEAACREGAVQHRTTRPYTPKTNGMVERFNGRVQREVLGITIHSHADLETLLKGFNRAYNARRQLTETTGASIDLEHCDRAGQFRLAPAHSPRQQPVTVGDPRPSLPCAWRP
jgi:transposase InsO family protein